MSVVLLFCLTSSVLCGMCSGTAPELAGAMLEGAKQGISLTVSLAGPLCLWCGLTNVMEQTGLTKKLAELLAPILKRLFPKAWQDTTARETLCGNLSANLLGLGSAATPLGIRAACAMAKDCDGIASDELCKLVVMNTASVQLIPSTVAALRASLGASSPFDILPAVWITSVCSVTAGLLAAKVMAKWC